MVAEQRFAVVARLKPEALAEAQQLVAAGPPFEPAELGFERHSVFLSYGEVVFVFEGREVEWAVDEIIDDPFRSPVFDAWKPLLDGVPRLAREAYFWER